MKIFKPLHNALLLFSAIFFIAAFITLKKTLQIHTPDAMLVVPFSRIFMAGAVYLSLLWLLYSFTGKFLFVKRLYTVHIIATILLLVLIIGTALWSNQLIDSYTRKDFLQKTRLAAGVGQAIIFASLILTTIQLLYPLNLIIGFIKIKNTKHVITQSKYQKRKKGQ